VASAHGDGQNTRTSHTDTQATGQQVTQGFSHLASTVPESHGLQPFLQVSNSLRPLAPPANPPPATKSLVRKMATQSSPHDTQELSPSCYESLINLNKTRGSARELLEDGKSQDPDVGVTQRTAHRGDSGHVDLGLSDSGPEDENQGSEPELNSEPIEFSPTQATQNRLSQFPESQRFKTPATNGKKRNHLGEIVESPALPRNPLARNDATNTPVHALGLSQAFAATQAGSSPAITRRISEPSSDRPSPNIEMQSRPANTSLSSPLRPRSEPRRVATEPRSRYVSIKQSQAERERLAELRQQSSDCMEADEQSDDNDDFNDEPSLVRRQKHQKERNDKVRERFARFSSPTYPRSACKTSDRAVITAKAPGSSPARSYDGSSGPRHTVGQTGTQVSAQLANESEEETEREGEGGDLEKIVIRHSSQQVLHDDDDDKENINARALQVPETVARPHLVLDKPAQQDESPSLKRSHSDLETSSAGNLQATAHPQKNGMFLSGSPTVAVVNSQPDQPAQERFASRSAHNSRVIPSSTHVSSSAVGPTQVEPIGDHENAATLHKVVRPTIPSGYDACSAYDPLSREGAQSSRDGLRDKQWTIIGEQLAGTRPDHQDRVLSKSFVHPPSTVPETLRTRPQPSIASHNCSMSLSSANDPGTEQLSDHSKRSSRYETAQTQFPDEPSTTRPPNELFASPSGRKRKRLGEIAAQPSPKRMRNDKDFDEIMAIIDDSESFKALDNVAGSSSPIPPGRNSRRVRLVGQRATSSRNISADSRVPSSPPTSVNLDGIQLPNEPATFRTPKTQSKPQRRAEAIWDVQVSPPKSATAPSEKKAAKTMKKISRRALRKHDSKPGTRQQSQPAESARSDPDYEGDKGPTDNRTSEAAHGVQPPDLTSREVVAPNQVLACFNGNPRGYYPATCIGSTVSRTDNTLRYKIHWDDSSQDDIDEHGIRRLDFHVGDQVKVNLQGWPRVCHVIRGFKERTEDSQCGMTDIRGAATLLLAPKKRKSLPSDVSTEQVKEAPISAIYLDTKMWGQMKSRIFQYNTKVIGPSLHSAIPRHVPSRAGMLTPERPSMPSTTSSRIRHRSDFFVQPANAAPPLPGQPIASVTFSNMAFAISYDKETRKTSLARAISTNGGTILREGFHEMFEGESTPTFPSRRSTDAGKLGINAQFSKIGFVALIADKHSRKLKYMQALALNIPCLSGKWIEACVASEAILNWQPYLLSAGESLELEGAVRSRVLPSIDINRVLLRDLTSERLNILKDETIILVTGKGKAEEKKKPYIFLLRAAGAGRVERCTDVKSAKLLLDGDAADEIRWVFVDDKELEKAKATLLAKGRGRKMREVRVVGKEFLCQSLILGRLWEQS
jgi:DNA repair protein Crb2 Tudor domain/BRCA1 C Terminus (BRCT) domain